MGDTEQWPAVNTLVSLIGSGWEGTASSRVEDLNDDILVVAAPHDPAGEALEILRPQPGDTVQVRWVHRRGMSERQAEVVAVEMHPRPQWRITASKPPDQIQRREAVRVEVLLELEVRHDGTSYKATTVDVSEGGLRCIIPAFATVEPGSRLELSFEVEGAPIAATAEVVRSRLTHDDFTQVNARFTRIQTADANRIRKFLFAEQVAQRRRERELA